MTKRIAATILWFYAGWYAGAMIAVLFGVSPALGPILGTAMAAIIGGDPRGIIWGRRDATPADADAPTAAAPQAAQTTI